MTIGAELRQAREQRGVSLRDLSERTKVRTSMLRAIEADDWQHLPGGLITRGFLKLYAREVGLDPDAIGARYMALMASAGSDGTGERPAAVGSDSARLDRTQNEASRFTRHRQLYLDHLTHNVRRGEMATWADFYERVFNFREIRYFDIQGKATGLFSKAMTSPDGKIRIPLNESKGEPGKVDQIEEFFIEYKGDGIQHIALGCENLYETVDELNRRGLPLQDTIDTYYDLVDTRLPGHGDNRWPSCASAAS